jgi:hypothetical protein
MGDACHELKPPVFDIWGYLTGKAFHAFDTPIHLRLIRKTDMYLTIWKAFSILSLKKWQSISCFIELRRDVRLMLAVRAVQIRVGKWKFILRHPVLRYCS